MLFRTCFCSFSLYCLLISFDNFPFLLYFKIRITSNILIAKDKKLNIKLKTSRIIHIQHMIASQIRNFKGLRFDNRFVIKKYLYKSSNGNFYFKGLHIFMKNLNLYRKRWNKKNKSNHNCNARRKILCNIKSQNEY